MVPRNGAMFYVLVGVQFDEITYEHVRCEWG